MSSAPNQGNANFIYPNIILPEDWAKARNVLIDYLLRNAQAVNTRDISQYQKAQLNGAGVNISQVPNGQSWFTEGNAVIFRNGYRTVVDIGGLANHAALTTQSVAHGIQTTQNTRFTRIYGTATAPGASTTQQAIPLPYMDVDALQSGIEVWVDSVNVNLRYQANYSAFTTAYIVIEFIENT